MATQQRTDTTKQQTRTTTTAEEAPIRELLDRWVKAFRAGNIDDLMKLYTDDVVAFDFVPPLQYVGRADYRKSWEKSLSMMGTPWVYNARDIKVTAGSDVAFVTALVECGGTNKEGKTEAGWIRHTIGLKKVDGKWLIAHEQMSIPVTFNDEGKPEAHMDLKPEEVVH